MGNGSSIYYICIYAQVILQLLTSIAVIYLICWPLRDVLYALSSYLKNKQKPSHPIDTDSSSDAHIK